MALEHEGAIVAGAMALPALGETYWAARGRGAWLASGDGAPLRLAVSRIGAWEDATLSWASRTSSSARRCSSASRRSPRARSARCYGDLAGAALVLQGKAEAWIEAGVQLWDLGPLPVLAEEAGGRFTDLDGRPTMASGSCVLSNGLVHEHVLLALAGR